MPCRFILGRAGAGKSEHCLHNLAAAIKEQKEALLIVPEQATFLYESRLARGFGLAGFSGLRITSFSRLAHRAEAAFAQDHLPPLSESGKRMALAKILQENQAALQVFQGGAGRMGFGANLLRLLEEFRAYRIEPDMLSLQQAPAAWQQKYGAGNLPAKLADIALVDRAFRAFCAGSYRTAFDGLDFLARAIYDRGFLNRMQIYIDGFSGFNPQEEAVLAALLARAPRVEIALPLDPAYAQVPAPQESLFYPVWYAYCRLLQLAQEVGAETEAPLCLRMGPQNRFAAAPALAFLERELYPPTGSRQWQGQPQGLQIAAAQSPSAELEGVAQEILRLVRQEHLHFRDISVIVRDAAPYAADLERIFSEYDIPYFIDIAKPLVYHPLVELVRAVLEVAVGGWHYPALFRYLKNPFSPLTLEEADTLENYCLAAGIRAHHWQSKTAWQFWPGRAEEAEEKLAEIEALRQRASAALAAFTDRFPPQAEVPVAAFCQALGELLENLDVEARLEKWQEKALPQGEAEQAALNQQAWEALQGLLAETTSFLGQSSMPLAECNEVLEAGLSSLTALLIPPGLDQVLVASLARSRNPEIQAAFVIGVNSGELPQKSGSEGLLTPFERLALAELGLDLGPDQHFRQLAEEYLAYVGLTRPARFLYVSYHLSDFSGAPSAPSPLIARLRELFPALTEQLWPRQNQPALFQAGNRNLAELALALSDAKKGLPLAPFWNDVYNWYLAHPAFGPRLENLLRGLYYQPLAQPLGEASRRRLFGRDLASSVSRLERYRACPFAYCASYGLELKRRRVYEISAADRGQLFHAVLADIGRRLAAEDFDWQKMDQELATQVVRESLERFLPLFLGDILHSGPRYTYLAGRFENVLVNTLLIWAEHHRHGSFVPIAWELAFGKDGELPALVIPLEDGRKLSISGMIDRVDAAQDAAGCTWFRIIDYKTGRQNLTKEDVQKGLKLQLMVYLQVVLENAAALGAKQARPAGVYYAWVRDDLAALPMPAEADEAQQLLGLRLAGLTVQNSEAVRLADQEIQGHSRLIPAALKKDGSFYGNSPGISESEMADLQQYLLQLLAQTAQAMLSGEIAACPAKQNGKLFCDFCDFKAVCSFDGEAGRQQLRAKLEGDAEAEGEEDQEA